MKNKRMFSAMRDIFYGGEFSHWLDKQENIPWAALKEYDEAREFFAQETGFVYPTDEEEEALKKAYDEAIQRNRARYEKV